MRSRIPHYTVNNFCSKILTDWLLSCVHVLMNSHLNDQLFLIYVFIYSNPTLLECCPFFLTFIFSSIFVSNYYSLNSMFYFQVDNDRVTNGLQLLKKKMWSKLFPVINLYLYICVKYCYTCLISNEFMLLHIARAVLNTCVKFICIKII